MTKKVLINNVDLPNRGNQALTLSTIDTIKEFIPEAEFTLMGRKGGKLKDFEVKKAIGYGPEYSEVTSKRIYYVTYYIFTSVFYLLLCCIINILSRVSFNIPLSTNSPLYDYYNCDIFINSGGDSLSGEYGTAITPILINIFYGILLRKPIVLYGESMGNIKNSVLNAFFTFIINRTDLILLRDEISKKYLEKSRINKPKIYLTADPAFVLEPSSSEHVFELLIKENINELKNPVLGINPSGLIGGFMKIYGKDDLNTMLANVIDFLIEKHDMDVILIPHVFSNTDDDRESIEEIFSQVNNKFKVKIIKNEYSAEELKGIIGLCDLLVAARMHATIAATSMLVPTVAVAYSHKTEGIIGKMLGQEKYVVNIKNLDYENLVSTIDSAWVRKEQIKVELKQKMPEVKEKALLNGKLVKEFVDSLKNNK